MTIRTITINEAEATTARKMSIKEPISDTAIAEINAVIPSTIANITYNFTRAPGLSIALPSGFYPAPQLGVIFNLTDTIGLTNDQLLAATPTIHAHLPVVGVSDAPAKYLQPSGQTISYSGMPSALGGSPGTISYQIDLEQDGLPGIDAIFTTLQAADWECVGALETADARRVGPTYFFQKEV